MNPTILICCILIPISIIALNLKEKEDSKKG